MKSAFFGVECLVPGFLIDQICIFVRFVLNLSIAMRTTIRAILLVLLAACLTWAPALALDGPVVTSPRPGDALQGLVVITGSTDLAGFQSVEVSFNYLSGSPDTWFLIQQSRSPVREGALAVWDTTTIADGTYRLRVQVLLPDGKHSDVIISGLRVRNYTPIETNTPAPVQKTEPAAASPTPIPPTLTPRVTPTLLPPNSLTIRPMQLTFGAVEGAAAVVIGFGLLGLYLWIKRR